MIIFIIILICALLIILLFTSRRLSPIPYFPSNRQDLPLILKVLNLVNGQTVVDLGAGDGLVIFEAAAEARKRKLSTQFMAVEINPILILILHLRRLLHPNRKNIKVVYGNILSENFKFKILNSKIITIYLYISPWFMEKVYKKLMRDLKTFHLVSYFYPLKSKGATKTIKGKNKVFIYEEEP